MSAVLLNDDANITRNFKLRSFVSHFFYFFLIFPRFSLFWVEMRSFVCVQRYDVFFNYAIAVFRYFLVILQ